MKLVTKIATIATLASFMFAGMNVTWGNTYTDVADDLSAGTSFGVHFDVNDDTTIGWENGLMVGLAGPGDATFRLGYNDVPTLGMSYTWWEGAGAGWATTLTTAIDFGMVGVAGVAEVEDSMGCDADGNVVENGTLECGDGEAAIDAIDAGDFTVRINLGFGF